MVICKIAKPIIVVIILAAILRFYHLGINPPSPYWEEAALGYDAYSILKTGKDFHGNSWPLIAFESFGDYKPSLYFYTTVPSVALFGLNTFAVRFPSALFGTLTVLLVYLLIKDKRTALIASLLLAISPWHLQLSRAGFEANLGLFLLVLGVFWSPALALSMYAYHANRILAPLLFLVLAATGRIKKIWSSSIVFLVLILPILWQFNSPVIRQRFAETSALATLDPIIKSNQLIAADGGGTIARLVHHRFWHYSQIFLTNYFNHFSFKYLFLSGDTNPRHSIQTVGGLYLIQLPFLLYGLLQSLKKRTKTDLMLLAWLFLAPIPAALTLASPHALRSLPMLIPLTIFTAKGVIRFKKIFLIILLIEASRYLYLYHQVYPNQWSSQWQYGYQEMVQYVDANQDKYNQIYITRQLGRPSIYYWFYTKTDPRLVQALNSSVPKDQGEYLEFGKIKFQDEDYLPNSLVVSEESGKFKIYEN
ncbi:glycosyltransferase family 39 protein [Patescibacteria group bacterium]|nr:glycosyltransferase family 39 protein [Patescibacteria group bacterium]